MKTIFTVANGGNTSATLMCLASVLNAETTPDAVLLIDNGEFPTFGCFYMEQLSALARIKGVEFGVVVNENRGVRYVRDYMVETAIQRRYDYLWMGDNDVVYHPSCLAWLLKVVSEFPKTPYVQGGKIDVNNRRGYPNFALTPLSSIRMQGANYNVPYSPAVITNSYVHTMDTGNVLLRVSSLLDTGIRFSYAENGHYNAGGEDTIMGARLSSAVEPGVFSPKAVSYHLEKPTPNFGEFAARGESILRAFETLDIKQEVKKKALEEFMPFLRKV